MKAKHIEGMFVAFVFIVIFGIIAKGTTVILFRLLNPGNKKIGLGILRINLENVLQLNGGLVVILLLEVILAALQVLGLAAFGAAAAGENECGQEQCDDPDSDLVRRHRTPPESERYFSRSDGRSGFPA